MQVSGMASNSQKRCNAAWRMEMFKCLANFSKITIHKPGIVRLTWTTFDMPGDAPGLADGDTVTRKPPHSIACSVQAPGVHGPAMLVQEKFTRKDGLASYDFTMEVRDLDADDEQTQDLLRRALMLDLSGIVAFEPSQGELPLDEKQPVH